MAEGLSLSILNRWDAVQAIGRDWCALRARCSHNPFDGFEFCELWWETLGKERRRAPHIVVAHRGAQLVGVLPLVVTRYKGLRLLKWAGKDLFDYTEALAETPDVVEALWQTALRSPAYDVAFLGGIRDHAAETRALRSVALTLDHNQTSHLPVPWTSRDAWHASQSSHHRRKTKSSRRALAQLGEIAFDVHHGLDLPSGTVATMVQQKLAWYGTRPRNGLFGHPRVVDIFERFALAAAQHSSLFLSVLRVGDTPVAHAFGFLRGHVLHLYCTSYDQAFAKHSPGRTLLEEIFGWCVDHGVREIDLMRGNEEYKNRYDPVIRPLPSYVYGRSLIGKVVVGCYGLYVRRRAAKIQTGSTPSPAADGLQDLAMDGVVTRNR